MSRRDDDAMNAFDSTPFHVEWTGDGHVVEESVYAWLDGALGAPDGDAVERHVQACSECAASVADARGYIAASVRIMNAADLSPRHVVPREDVARTAARIVALADRTPVSTITLSRARKNTRASGSERSWYTRPFGPAAAALLLVAVGTFVATRSDDGVPARNVAGVLEAPGKVAPTDANSASASVKLQTPPAVATAVTSTRATVVAGTAAGAATGKEREAKKERTDAGPVATTAVLPRTQPLVTTLSSSPPARVPQILPDVAVRAAGLSIQLRGVGSSTSAIAATEPLTNRTVSGTVTDQATSAPIVAANVLVPGTSLVANTDEKGNFILRDVPVAATKLQVRRLGYSAAEILLDSLAGSVGSANASLVPATMMLDGVVVTSVSAKSVRPEMSSPCLAVYAEPSGDQAAMVRSIRVRQDPSGTYSGSVTGWPSANSETRVTLTSDAAKALRGNVQSGSDRLEIELISRGDNWFGTLREYHGANIRSVNIKYTRDALSVECR